MRRGLTLIEVVAATALLTLIVMACVPILRGARRDLAAARQTSYRAESAAFADAVDTLLLEQPRLVAKLLDQPEGLTLDWMVRDESFTAEARLLSLVRAEDDEHRSSHCWVVFDSSEVEIIRWLRVPIRLLHEEPGA